MYLKIYIGISSIVKTNAQQFTSSVISGINPGAPINSVGGAYTVGEKSKEFAGLPLDAMSNIITDIDLIIYIETHLPNEHIKLIRDMTSTFEFYNSI